MADQTRQLAELLETEGARLHALLFRLTLRVDVADDLLQDLFLKMACSPGFSGAKNPAAYLYRSASNLAFDWRRSRRRGIHIDSESCLIDNEVGDEPPPIRSLILREEFDRVLDAIEQLPESQREIVVMRFLEQLSHQEIAERTCRTEHQVRGLCAKAIQRLRALTDSSLANAGFLREQKP